jgi:hypothetical protein
LVAKASLALGQRSNPNMTPPLNLDKEIDSSYSLHVYYSLVEELGGHFKRRLAIKFNLILLERVKKIRRIRKFFLERKACK